MILIVLDLDETFFSTRGGLSTYQWENLSGTAYPIEFTRQPDSLIRGKLQAVPPARVRMLYAEQYISLIDAVINAPTAELIFITHGCYEQNSIYRFIQVVAAEQKKSISPAQMNFHIYNRSDLEKIGDNAPFAKAVWADRHLASLDKKDRTVEVWFADDLEENRGVMFNYFDRKKLLLNASIQQMAILQCTWKD